MAVFPAQSCDSSVTSAVSSIDDFEIDCDIRELPLPICEDDLLDIPLPWPETPVVCAVPQITFVHGSSFNVTVEAGGPEGNDWCNPRWTFYSPFVS